MKIRILGHTISAITFILGSSIVAVVIMLIITVKMLVWVSKEDNDIRLGKFFSIVLKALPDEDLDAIVMRGKFLEMYKHRQKDVWRIIKEIVRYGEENFSDNGKHILNSTVPQFLEEIDKACKPSHALSIKEAMNMRANEILRHHLMFSLGNRPISRARKWYISFFIEVALFVPSFMFFYCPSNLAVILNICSVVVAIFAYQLFQRKLVPLSIVHVSVHWMVALIITAFSPHFLFRRALKNWFWWPVVSLLFFAMVGLWMAHKIWTKTDYEKRKSNTFIAHDKILFIFEIKIMPKIRYVILWMICVFTIFCTIMMYAVMYHKLFYNTLLYCTFLSVSTYLGAGYFSLDSIGVDSVESIYLLSETAISFLLNTFYIAYIVNLMHAQKSG